MTDVASEWTVWITDTDISASDLLYQSLVALANGILGDSAQSVLSASRTRQQEI